VSIGEWLVLALACGAGIVGLLLAVLVLHASPAQMGYLTAAGLAPTQNLTGLNLGGRTLAPALRRGGVVAAPVTVARTAPAPARTPIPDTTPSRMYAHRRVLVVDDEALLLKAYRRMLSDAHDLTTALGGLEALRTLGQDAAFDVILCDLMMPEMTGMDLHAELTKLAPDQVERVVFVTGGAFTPRAREFLERVPNARVEKPIDFQNLRLLLRNLRR
jgi:CheY-like chemotaxis protein